MTKRLYEIADATAARMASARKEDMVVRAISEARNDPEAVREALEAWFGPVFDRAIARRKPKARSTVGVCTPLPSGPSKTAAAITKGFVKAAARFADELRLPDGRLFADVPYYEHGEIKRISAAWVTIIDGVANYARVNDLNQTPRQVVPDEILRKIVGDSGLPKAA